MTFHLVQLWDGVILTVLILEYSASLSGWITRSLRCMFVWAFPAQSLMASVSSGCYFSDYVVIVCWDVSCHTNSMNNFAYCCSYNGKPYDFYLFSCLIAVFQNHHCPSWDLRRQHEPWTFFLSWVTCLANLVWLRNTLVIVVDGQYHLQALSNNLVSGGGGSEVVLAVTAVAVQVVVVVVTVVGVAVVASSWVVDIICNGI